MTAKKNVTLRVAVVLLALALITSCFVGSTFAKYVTAGEGAASARVAKFGVNVKIDNDTMFKTTYETDDSAVKTSITNSVESYNTDKLVAPGTKEENLTTFSVTGKPEVAVKVELKLDDSTLKEVFLKAGTYANYTTADATDTFTLADDYYPVKFTLTQNGTKVVDGGKLSDVKAKLDVSKNYTANTDLSTELGNYTLSWEWAFDGNDAADTLLGNLAAQTATGVDPANYSTQIAFKLSATVTQID